MADSRAKARKYQGLKHLVRWTEEPVIGDSHWPFFHCERGGKLFLTKEC